MTKSREEKRRLQGGVERVKAVSEMRIDPAHEAARPDAAAAASGPVPAIAARETAAMEMESAAVMTPVMASAMVPVMVDAAGDRLRKQADQLATHLRTRQKEIDSRESQLNAQLAQFDRDARSARMWLSEHEASLTRRSEELDQREHEIKVRLARLAAEASQQGAADRPAKLAQREAELAERERTLHQREDSLGEKEQLLASRVEASAAAMQQAANVPAAAPPANVAPAVVSPAAVQNEERAASLARYAEQLEAKQHDLQRAETQLAQAVAETERLRREVQTDRDRIEQEAAEMRGRLQQEHQIAMAEVETLRKAVQRRGEHVDRTRAALRQLRVELGRMHRETLESQLATEELWIRMSENAPAASLTRSLGRIRSRLAEQYHLTVAEVQSEKDELEKIREQITAQFEKLQQQKREIERWAVAKHEEADKHAARLIARERELEEQHYEIQEQAQRLQAERLSYHRAVRRIETEQVNLPQTGTAG